jgi:Superfamily II DNA/RNA helicases, SNF2 family
MQTKVIDYNLKLTNVTDLEEFSTIIKNAMVDRLAIHERFSALRLAKVKLNYNDWMHKGYAGVAHSNGTIEVRDTNNHALTLAGTVIHELGHQLAGVDEGHSQNWIDACKLLGLLNTKREKNNQPEDFDKYALQVIEKALLKFVTARPELVINPDIEIPWPSHIGLWTCPNPHESFHACYVDGKMVHKCHILQFQDEDIRDMLRRIKEGRNILNANEMGLGKTVELMGLINVLHPKRIFVGCPNNAKLVWRNHFRDFCVHDYGDDLEVAHTSLYMFSDVVIMNYEALRKWKDAISKEHWDMVIFDEGQYLKTPNAKRSEAAYSVKGDIEVIITGTPIVNYPYEIFPLIHYLDRANWPEYGHFEASYGSKSSDRLGRNLTHLQQKLRATIMLRRLKKDVMKELPKKRRQIIEFEPSEEIKELIESEMSLFNQLKGNDFDTVKLLNTLKNESEEAIEDIDWHSVILSLAQTKRFAFEEMAKIAHEIGRAKLPYIYEHIEQVLENREKVIVFGHHRDVLSKIAARFAPNSVLLLGGNQDQAAATSMASQKFNDDDNCRLFVGGISIAASYSLIGSSTVVFVEESWIPGEFSQAEDRGHGIGRGDAEAKSMLIQHLVFEDSLDTKKAQLNIRKQKSIDRAMNRF